MPETVGVYSGETVGVYSGGFDPIHTDHILRIRQAKEHCDKLYVIVEPDEFVRLKHKVFYPQQQRIEILKSIQGVDHVLAASTEVTTSCLLGSIRPDVFFIGKDHKNEQEIPEWATCKAYEIEIYKLGPNTVHSSDILKEYIRGMCQPVYNNPPVTVSVLLVSKYGTVLIGERPDGKLDLPGGFLEPGEDLEKCARREFEEETGGKLTNLKYFMSMKGEYPTDGRDIVSVYFTSEYRSGDDVMKGSAELPKTRWTSELPKYPDFFSYTDCFALGQFFIRKKQPCSE